LDGKRKAARVFNNLGAFEVGALLLLALLIFGDKLPSVINDGLRMLRSLRTMARNASSDLSRELGTDIQLEDLHPKAFIRKHLLSEEDEQAIRRPIKTVYDNVRSDLSGVHDELNQVASAADIRANRNGRSSHGQEPPATPASRTHTYDVDAT
jgi:sec-independent protein translocase protein TatB